MRKVLFFNYEYPPLGGGAANATKYIMEEFARRGDVHVDVITSAVDNKARREHVGGHVTIHYVPIGHKAHQLNFQTKRQLLMYSWRALRCALQLMRHERYDLTHSFFAVPCGVLSLFFKKWCDVPYIVSLRGADVPGYSERFMRLYGVLRPLVRWVWREASHVVTNSKGLRDLAATSAPMQPFSHIPNGVDTHFYTPGARTDEDRRTVFRILCAARLSRRKGFADAITAFAALADDYPHATLTIAGGEGNATAELKAQAAQTDCAQRIIFTGLYTKEESPDMYRAADVFVMPSYNEGMSNNVLEALASGLPIVMTPTGGSHETVQDGDNGFVVPMHDPAAIATALRRLMDEEGLCARMGAASRARAVTMSWASVAQQYWDLYHNTP